MVHRHPGAQTILASLVLVGFSWDKSKVYL